MLGWLVSTLKVDSASARGRLCSIGAELNPAFTNAAFTLLNYTRCIGHVVAVCPYTLHERRVNALPPPRTLSTAVPNFYLLSFHGSSSSFSVAMLVDLSHHHLPQLNVLRQARIDQRCSAHSVFLFPSGVLGIPSADNHCARHSRPFCFALLFFDWLRKRTARRFRVPPHKVQGLRHFRKPGEKL